MKAQTKILALGMATILAAGIGWNALAETAASGAAPVPTRGWSGMGYYTGAGGMGPGMMGYGMMGGYGPGMMGYGMMSGYGPGMMGWGHWPQQANLNLSTSDVKSHLDRYIAVMGNPHLKAGPVTEKDANTITAEIVTTDKDALVQQFNVDRRTGFWQPVQ